MSRRIHPDMPSVPRAAVPRATVPRVAVPRAAVHSFRDKMASFFQNMFIRIRRPRTIHPVVAMHENPYTQEVIEVSIHPNSAYVKLYKKVMRELIKDLRSHYNPHHILTLEDCKYIKDNLPIIHSIIEITEEVYIRYDHLFIRYFIKNMKAYYDIKYCEDSEIKLHLNIYNSIKTKNPTTLSPKKKDEKLKLFPIQSPQSPQSPSSRSFAIGNYRTLEDLLKDNIDFAKSDISIGKLVANMCVDIKHILYMREDDITLENYRTALHNKKTLEYVNYIYLLKFADISGISNKIEIYYTHLNETLLPEHNIDEIKHIYKKIKTNMSSIREELVCQELIHIYNKYILCLYARYFNQFIDPSKEIVDNYDNETSSGSKIKLNPYCPKDIRDFLTQEKISDFRDTKRKYVTNMIVYNSKIKKVFYYCFDTVYLYNYILYYISVKDRTDKKILKEILKESESEVIIPKKPFTNLPFTDEELDEICNKVKKLTEMRTYNSHIDIKEAIIQRYMEDVRRIKKNYLSEPNNLTYDDSKDWRNTRDILQNYKKKYDNSYLLLVRDQLEYFEDNKTIKGEYRVYIAINFDNLSYLHIINPLVTDISKDTPYLIEMNNSFLLRLPIFKEKHKDKNVLEFLDKIKKGIESGNYISNDIFPYRKGNDPIIQLKQFDFNINEDVNILYAKFMKYASENDNIIQGGTKQKRQKKRTSKRK